MAVLGPWRWGPRAVVDYLNFNLIRAEPDVKVSDGGPWRNDQAIVIGQAKSGRIIVAAAAVMILVFGSFMLGGQRSLQEFGFGLGFSVLVDAMIIRSLLILAIMHIIGTANWSMPSWISRCLPNILVEVDDRASSAVVDDRASVSEVPVCRLLTARTTGRHPTVTEGFICAPSPRSEDRWRDGAPQGVGLETPDEPRVLCHHPDVPRLWGG